MEQRVAFVSTCGSGHLNTIRSLWKGGSDSSRLFLVRFEDEPVPFEHTRHVVVLTARGKRPSENAKDFNEARSKVLHDALHVWLYDFAPTVVVYDFFCLEARASARLIGVPAICSIPATLKPDETITCSDGVLPQEHFYWVWRQPYEVAIRPVAFLGGRQPITEADVSFVPYGAVLTIITFGTVVPKYVGCQERLHKIMSQIEDYISRDGGVGHYVFLGIQGPEHERCKSFPNAEECDLVSLYRKAWMSRLIFHGGGNTYAEALAARVPFMLVCPFFGDQFETARQCGNIYSGDLEHDLRNLKDQQYPEVAPKLDIPFADRFPDYWRPGDLVFGQKLHRRALQKAFPQIDLHLEHFKPFAHFADPSRGDLPAIADVYNDEPAIAEDGTVVLTGNNPYQSRMADVALARSKRAPSVKTLPADHRLVYHCLDILELTVRKWSGRVHFVVGPKEDLGPATRIELAYVQKEWGCLLNHVIFYDLEGRRIPAPFAYVKAAHPGRLIELHQRNEPIVEPLRNIPGRMPVVWGREKHPLAINDKRFTRRLPVLDTFGWRTGYLDAHDLADLQTAVNPSWMVSVNWCEQRVWFYYYRNQFQETTELQIWPWTYLHHFYRDRAGLGPSGERQYEMQKALESIH